MSGKCHHVGVWSCHARSPNSARAHSCKYKYKRKANTNTIERQTRMKTKVLIPQSPQSQDEHTLAITNLLFIFIFFCHGNHLTQQEHTFANRNIFFKIYVLDIFNTFDFYFTCTHASLQDQTRNPRFFLTTIKNVFVSNLSTPVIIM